MAPTFHNWQTKDENPQPCRRTGCTTCDEGYMTFVPPPHNPYLLRQEFRRRPFNAPKPAPPYALDSLNHADIAPLHPIVEAGQEDYAFLTDWQIKRLKRARMKQGEFSVPDDDEGWGIMFLPNFFWRGLVALLAWIIGWAGVFAVPIKWVFDIVSSGPFLPVLTVCSIYWYYTSVGVESLWLGRAIFVGLMGTIGMTMTKFYLGR